MAAGPTTIYDVAREAGVSTATVSNVLNRPGRVGAQTRARVLEVVDRLGFVPKEQAVSRARRGVGRVAVVAPFTAYTSYMERLAGILAEAAVAGVDISVFDQESAADSPSPILATLPLQGAFDGLVVMGMGLDDATADRLVSRAVPTVLVDASSDYFPTINCDDREAGRLAALHLLGLGHRQLAYLRERQVVDYPSQASARLDGFAEAVTAGGASLVVHACGPDVRSARAAATQILRAPEPPSAVMAHFDDIAVGVLQAARQLSVEVPRDLSVMGCDDGPVAVACGLTTVRQPFRESGSLALRTLLRQVSSEARASERDHSRTSTVLHLEVVTRDTSGRRQEAM